MADSLSQDDINALFENKDANTNVSNNALLSDLDKDVIGEVGNISMGSAATTLSSLLNQKVNITTPVVKEKEELDKLFDKTQKYVAINIKYKTGLDGTFLLIIKEDDVKIISSIMMGGEPDKTVEVDDLHLSAMSEAMNQMVGTSCTSMSQVFDNVVDINPPSIEKIDPTTITTLGGVDLSNDDYVIVEFDLIVGDLINSKMLQIIPLDVAKQLISKLTGANNAKAETASANNSAPEPAPASEPASAPEVAPARVTTSVPHTTPVQATNAQSVEFADLVEQRVEEAKEQISLIQDVPLEVVVELGRTNKSIKEILEFSPGVVIELNKMAGEPIDILINNKFIAKGEVVVIDENFGIRITEIIDVKKRI